MAQGRHSVDAVESPLLGWAVKEGCVPFGYYGPETCRSATPDEMRRFGLEDCPMVHLDKSGEIDCYFTETGATVIPGASYH
jgi:hypothetical protein